MFIALPALLRVKKSPTGRGLAQLCTRKAGFEFDLLSMYYLRSIKPRRSAAALALR
jgi:hypothetical protein